MLEKGVGSVKKIAFSPNGAYVVAGTESERVNVVRLWKVEADTAAIPVEGVAERLKYDITASAVAGAKAAGGEWANYRDRLRKGFEQVLGQVNAQRLVDKHQALLGTLGSFGSPSFSVDGKRLFVIKERINAVVYDVTTRLEMYRHTKQTDVIMWVGEFPDGKWVGPFH